MLGMRLRKVPVDDRVPDAPRRARRRWTMPPSSSPPSARPRRRRSIRFRRSPTRARRAGRGCTSTPRTRARRWSAPSSGGRSRGRARRLARRQRAQVDAHADGLLAAVDHAGRDDFRRAFSLIPEYLRTPDAEDALSLSEYGPALGRRFRALKLWAVLRCYGAERLAAPHPQRHRARRRSSRRWVARGRRLGAVCAPALLARVLPTRGRRRPEPGAARAGQRERGDLHLPRGAERRATCCGSPIGQVSTTEDDVRRAWEVLVREAS